MSSIYSFKWHIYQSKYHPEFIANLDKMSGSSAFDHQFKFCLVGPSRVGKTSIKVRATDFIFSESYLATIGPEFVEIVYDFNIY